MADNIEQLKAQLKIQMDQLTESKKTMEQAFSKMQSSLNQLPKELEKKYTSDFKAVLMSDGKVVIEFSNIQTANKFFEKL
jgi:hypothetical protein